MRTYTITIFRTVVVSVNSVNDYSCGPVCVCVSLPQVGVTTTCLDRWSDATESYVQLCRLIV